MKQEDLRPTAMELCLAIKAQKTEWVEALADKLLELQSFPEATGELLWALQSAFSAASRLRDTSIFIMLLKKCSEALFLLLERSQFHKEFLELLSSLLFISCDKKIVGTAEILEKLCKKFFTVADAFSRESWCLETLSLAARILRRGWTKVGQWLLILLYKLLWKKGNDKLIKNVLSRTELHMVLSCRYDGLEKTLDNYWPMQVFLLLLLKKAEHKEVHEAYSSTVMVLRSLRGIFENSAVGLMQDELEIYEAWNVWLFKAFNQVENLTKAESKSWMRRKQLVQLAIRYWNKTKPKTSRKQIRYLQELLEPDYLSSKQKRFLELI